MAQQVAYKNQTPKLLLASPWGPDWGRHWRRLARQQPKLAQPVVAILGANLSKMPEEQVCLTGSGPA